MSTKRTVKSAANKRIGEKIKQLREERQLTQTEFGKLFYLSQNDITNIEKGYKSVSYEVLLSIANYFCVSTDYLLKENSVKESNPRLQYICDYTGLDNDTLEILHSLVIPFEYSTGHKYVFEFIKSLIKCIDDNSAEIECIPTLIALINSQCRDNDFETAYRNNKELKIINFELIQAFNKVIENYYNTRTIIDKADKLYNDYCKKKYQSFTGLEIEITEIESDNENE